MSNTASTLRNRVGLWLAPLVAISIQLLPVPASLEEIAIDAASARQAWIVLSLIALMVIWWVSEAIPIPVTSMLPMVILPLAGVAGLKAVAAPYFHPIVVLLMGGFIVAKAIEKWNLHERFALQVLTRVGNRPTMLVAGFMLASALLSMWISNTATAIMMMPIALSVAAAILDGKDNNHPFTYALLLGIAYACSIGGLGTPIGTPTNLIIIGYLNEKAGFNIGFLEWMMLGLPAVVVLVPLAWWVLTRWVFKLDVAVSDASQSILRSRLSALGRLTTPEKRTLMVFSFIAILWVFRKPLHAFNVNGTQPFSGLSDGLIAILGVILCFLVPSGGASDKRGDRILDWRSAESIPWGVLLLFGGGMSLAGAISDSGLGNWVGLQMAGLSALPTLMLIFALTLFVIFATEVTSNVATASALMPVLGSAALAAGLDIELLAAPLALAASCAFMLPMATGPNAVVFATDRVGLPIMAKAGFRLNLVALLVITALSMYLPALVFA